jgi:LPXTG-motif cell wall-anchored protein
MKRYILGGLTAAGLLLSGLGSANSATAADGHILVVNGTAYTNTHQAGSTFHWETPPVASVNVPVSFAERGQVWTGQGFQLCEFGAHWISNENNLVQSGCVDGPTDTTSTTTTTTTTTLVPPPPPPGVPGVLVVPPPPTEVTPSTSVASAGPVPPTVPIPSVSPTGSGSPVPSVSPTGSGSPVPSVAPPGGVAPGAGAPTQELPSTGSSSWGTALVALAALLGGLGLVKLSRRPS